MGVFFLNTVYIHLLIRPFKLMSRNIEKISQIFTNLISTMHIRQEMIASNVVIRRSKVKVTVERNAGNSTIC